MVIGLSEETLAQNLVDYSSSSNAIEIKPAAQANAEEAKDKEEEKKPVYIEPKPLTLP